MESRTFTKENWLNSYVKARYGVEDEIINKVWLLLGKGIYNSPKNLVQQGTHESVFCARPAEDVYQVSSWSEMKDYYNPQEVIEAARLMISIADKYKGNNNFEFDLTDILRQAIAEKGRLSKNLLPQLTMASRHFLQLILLQDELLATRPEFKVGKWISNARALGNTPTKKHYMNGTPECKSQHGAIA